MRKKLTDITNLQTAKAISKDEKPPEDCPTDKDYIDQLMRVKSHLGPLRFLFFSYFLLDFLSGFVLWNSETGKNDFDETCLGKEVSFYCSSIFIFCLVTEIVPRETEVQE